MLRSLVAQAQDGDEEAFVSLVQAVGDRCLAIAYRILRDLPTAEDAVQHACTVAWRELPMLRDRDRFEQWLHRILVHTCYAEAKRRRRDAAAALLASAIPTHPPDALRTVEDRDQPERGFRRLSPEQRAVIVFHHYLQLPMTEVAMRLGIPVGTAKSRLRYATASLRAALDADARPPAAAKERPA